MNTLLARMVVGLLKLVLRLIILAVTGEWVDLDKFGKRPEGVPAQQPKVDTQTPNRAHLSQQLEAWRSRQSPAMALERTQLEVFARDFGAAFEAHLREQGVGLRRRTFVALTDVDPSAASFLPDLRAYTRYWPITVSSRLGGIERYVLAARERARALAEDAPGFQQRLRRAHGWPEFLLLPPNEPRPSSDDIRVVHGAFGVWLPALLAEILLTLQLGPGYVAYLANHPEPETARVALNNRLLSDWPPHLLRLEVALGVLEFLGYFEEAERMRGALEKQFGETPSLPLPGAESRTLPHAFWRDQLEGLLESTLEDVQPAFGGQTLLDVPGGAYLHGEHARAQRLTAILLDRTSDLRAHREASARDWLAAALLAQGSRDYTSSRGAELVSRLRSALGGSDFAPPSEGVVPSAQPVSLARPSHLGRLLRDPVAVRDAVTLGALLGPRRHR